jgi:hypothetical protein
VNFNNIEFIDGFRGYILCSGKWTWFLNSVVMITRVRIIQSIQLKIHYIYWYFKVYMMLYWKYIKNVIRKLNIGLWLWRGIELKGRFSWFRIRVIYSKTVIISSVVTGSAVLLEEGVTERFNGRSSRKRNFRNIYNNMPYCLFLLQERKDQKWMIFRVRTKSLDWGESHLLSFPYFQMFLSSLNATILVVKLSNDV